MTKTKSVHLSEENHTFLKTRSFMEDISIEELANQIISNEANKPINSKLKTDKYEKDGQTRYSTKVIAKDLVMLGGKAEANQAAQDSHNQAKSDGYAPENDFNDNIPF